MASLLPLCLGTRIGRGVKLTAELHVRRGHDVPGEVGLDPELRRKARGGVGESGRQVHETDLHKETRRRTDTEF